MSESSAIKTPELPVSAVFDGISTAPIKVGRTDFPWGFTAGLIGVAVLGTIVFFSLSNDRSAVAQPAPQPVKVVQAAPPPLTPQQAFMVTEPQAPVTSVEPDESGRYSSPAMVVDLSEAGAAPAASAPSTATTTTTTTIRAGQPATSDQAGHNDGGGFAEDRFAAHVTSDEAETVYASHMHDTALTVPQGTVIPAILETGINSDLPGFVRAVVSRDVRGFDGSTVLIPRGSKLIGQYRSAVAVGVSRAFVVWSRLITPDGNSIDIGSPATDQLGQAGLEGETNSHFFERFGAAILLSVMSAGADALANNGSSGNTAIVIGSPQQATSVASIALQKYIDIPTTITVSQGAPLRVFVARDLDFSGVVQRKP